jgi:hypothetical protein
MSAKGRGCVKTHEVVVGTQQLVRRPGPGRIIAVRKARELTQSCATMSRRMVFTQPPLMNGPPSMGQLLLAVSLESASKRGPADLTVGRPALSAWLRRLSDYPAMRATALK